MTQFSSISKRIDQYNVSIHHDFLNPIFYHASIFRKSEPHIIGTGSASDKVLAAKIALSELTERFVYSSASIDDLTLKSTNGIASHTIIEFAQSNALYEVIERDLFLTSWLAKKAPLWIIDSPESGELWLQLKPTVDLFAANKYKLHIGLIGQTNGVWVATSALESLDNVNHFGIAIATAAHKELNIALKKAVEDQHRVVTILEDRKAKFKPLYSHETAGQICKPSDHFEFYLNPNHAKDIRWYIDQSDEPILSPDIKYTFENIPNNSMESSFFVVRCKSIDTQEYFYGQTAIEHINIQRAGYFTDNLNFNYQLHPLG